jgi:type III secretion protein C
VPGGPGGATLSQRVSSKRPPASLAGSGLDAARRDAPASAATGGDAEPLPASFAARDDLPQFQVDSRMNAVLVRDLPERMPEYERLIQAMDTRPRLVEIEVTIMDISNDSLDQLGVDWRAHGSRVDLQTGNGAAPALSWNSTATTAGQTGTAAPVGAVFTAAIGSELRNFLLARVSALAASGQASFVARPKVLTLDNTEASIENKSEFYIKVSGFQDASLYTVVAGTDVRVTPLIVDDGGGRGVMLNINIGDDSVSGDLVDNVPIVRRRSVITQAMVGEGKSVLLAGYSSEERTNSSSGVPLLSAIPGIGNLFKYGEKKRNNVERFYMLTPRFMLPEAMAAAAPGAAGLPPAGAPATAPLPAPAAASTPAPAPAPTPTPTPTPTPASTTEAPSRDGAPADRISTPVPPPVERRAP